jgi:hypothetical protein
VAQRVTESTMMVELGWRFGQPVVQAMKRPLQDGEFLARATGPGPLPFGSVRAEHHDSAHLFRGEVQR